MKRGQSVSARPGIARMAIELVAIIVLLVTVGIVLDEALGFPSATVSVFELVALVAAILRGRALLGA